MAKSHYLCAVFLITFFTLTFGQIGTPDYLLPKNVVPVSYDVRLVPYLNEGTSKDFTFDGRETIVVNVVEPTDSITLHILDMTIDEPAVSVINQETQTTVPISAHEYAPTYQFYIIRLSSTLTAGTYEINISFTGKLNNLSIGFYRSSYTDLMTGTTKWLATTQFESNDGRRAFPCFDEPAYKATFVFHLARFPEQFSLANTPLASTSEPDPTVGNRVWDTFEVTPVMPTYLTAFIVSELGSLKDGIHAVYSRPDRIQEGRYVLSLSEPTKRVLENFTEIPYPLAKLDHAAIPDYIFGGMENWGLVTYTESYFFYDDAWEDPTIKVDVNRVVVHEIAHLWFGDLVTPTWWKWAWLKEGMATYHEYVSGALVETDLGLSDAFLADMQYIMEDDADILIHPMTLDVYTTDEINGLYDLITYFKAGSVYRMIEHALTSETFRKGFSKLLKDHSYGVANSDDLAAAFQSQVDQDGISLGGYTVKQIIDSWTLQAGFPVVTIERDYVAGTATAKQGRFLTAGEPSAEAFIVPITYTTQSQLDFSNTAPSKWIDSTQAVPFADSINTTGWLIANLQVTGYYRVNYDLNNWDMLSAYIEGPDFQNVNELNRAQLLDDAKALSDAGLLPQSVYFKLTRYLSQETEYVPWKTAFNTFRKLGSKLIGTDLHQAFKDYVLHLMKKQYTSLGLESKPTDSNKDKMKRDLFVSWACQLDEPMCTDKARNGMKLWMSHGKELRLTKTANVGMYCNAIRHGGNAEWKFLLEQYRKSENTRVKVQILEALGCTKDNTLLNQYLDLLFIKGEGLKYLPAHGINRLDYEPLNFIHYNYEAMLPTLTFMNENTKLFEKHLKGRRMLSLLKPIAPLIREPEHIKQIQILLRDNLDAHVQKFIFDAMKNSMKQHLVRSSIKNYLKI